jgi:hypothetical protein
MDYKLRPISVVKMQKLQASVEKKFKLQGKLLEPPTYEVKLPGGVTQKHEYDQEGIDDPSTPEEDKAKWNQYQSDVMEFNQTFSELSMNMILYDGVELSDEISEDWLEEQSWMGIDIPENKFDLKVLYLQTEIFKTPSDLQKVVQDIMRISMKGVDQEAVDAAMASFRGAMETGEEQQDG